MKKSPLLLLLVLTILLSCKTQPSTQDSLTAVKEVIATKLGGIYDSSVSSNKEHILAWTKKDRSATPMLHFGVWQVESGDLLYSGSAIDGSVKWLDDTTLLLTELADKSKLGVYNQFRIEILTKVKTPLPAENN